MRDVKTKEKKEKANPNTKQIASPNNKARKDVSVGLSTPNYRLSAPTHRPFPLKHSFPSTWKGNYISRKATYSTGTRTRIDGIAVYTVGIAVCSSRIKKRITGIKTHSIGINIYTAGIAVYTAGKAVCSNRKAISKAGIINTGLVKQHATKNPAK